MKAQLTSALRHALTFLPALGAYFVSQGLLDPSEGATLDRELAEFLSVAAGLVASALARLVMFALAKWAPHLRGIFGGGSGWTSAVAMTGAAWGAILGGTLLTSCVVGVDEAGGWSVRPDPQTLDAGLKYLIRQEAGDAKDGLTQWRYYDPETGAEIPPADYAAWGINP